MCATSALTIRASYRVVPSVALLIAQGSVLNFVGINPCKSAIVNAANEGCLGGGGVDGAISAAGGPNLAQDRLALPILTESDHGSIRCHTGSAVITGPNSYDKLLTNYVIHAVGPNYWDFINEEEDDGGSDSSRIREAHRLLASAYKSSLTLAARYDIRSVGFSLLSAGVYRGNLPLETVLRIGVTAVQEWAQEAPEHFAPLDITMCAFTANECSVLEGICDELLCKIR